MTNLVPQIEALLFVSGEPLAFARISKLLGCSRKEVEQAIENLRIKLANDDQSGIFLIEHDEMVELATKGQFATLGEALTKNVREDTLSRAALEVLAIISYRAPITRSQIEAIRGVNCSFTLRNLLLRGLIERFENPEDNREYVYQPAFSLLEKLGLSSVKDLPQYQELSQDERLSLVNLDSSTHENANQLNTLK